MNTNIRYLGVGFSLTAPRPAHRKKGRWIIPIALVPWLPLIFGYLWLRGIL